MELSHHKYLTQPCKCYSFKIIIFQSEVNDKQCGSGCAGPVGVRPRPRDSHPCHEESPQKWSPSGTPLLSFSSGTPVCHSGIPLQYFRSSPLVIQYILSSCHSGTPLYSFRFSALVTQVLPSSVPGYSLMYSLLRMRPSDTPLQPLRCYMKPLR